MIDDTPHVSWDGVVGKQTIPSLENPSVCTKCMIRYDHTFQPVCDCVPSSNYEIQGFAVVNVTGQSLPYLSVDDEAVDRFIEEAAVNSFEEIVDEAEEESVAPSAAVSADVGLTTVKVHSGTNRVVAIPSVISADVLPTTEIGDFTLQICPFQIGTSDKKSNSFTRSSLIKSKKKSIKETQHRPVVLLSVRRDRY
eukprot:scaffold107138_cov38-Cyclotella_meneghiniana.AAC.1